MTSISCERPPEADRLFRLVLAGVGALTAVRVAILFLTPLELYPDEAQYWLWSRRFAFGYYSKPPMVAWLIALTTLASDTEPWVRLSAPLLHGLTALVQFKAASRLFGPREGALAAALYSLMPGVMLSSGVIATDAPLLLFASLALWAYAGLWRAQLAVGRDRAAAALGVALGCAFLSKYAAAYLVLGFLLHAATSSRARALWSARSVALAVGLAVLVLSPNLVWNARHGYSTLMHAANNADLDRQAIALDLGSALAFLVGQFGVFGPIPFALLLGGGTAALIRRRTVTPEEGLLLCLTAPTLVIILVEAFVARANANWAALAYVAACPLVASWLARRRARRTMVAIGISQGAFALLFWAVALSPALADAVGLAPALKRARGRAQTAAVLQQALAKARRSRPVTAIAMDYRFDFNNFAYYGRELLASPGAPPLRMWVRQSRPRSQAELESPLRLSEGGRVLFVNVVDDFAHETRADFAQVEDDRRVRVRLDARHSRAFSLFVGVGYRPRPRDPVTGLPTPP